MKTISFKTILDLLKETWIEFSKDNASRLAAALAYYTIFSIAPLLVIAIAIAGLVFTKTGASEQISHQMKGLVGDTGAVAIQTMIESAMQPKKSVVAVIIGSITLLFGASGAFGELKAALNTVWKAKPPATSGILGLVKERFLSFTMVLGTGFLLLVSLILSAGLTAAGQVFNGMLPGWAILAQVLNIVISLGLISVLFAMIFKVLPDVHIRWSDVWHGAFATALLFTIGKWALGLYLGRSAVSSSYGAAGSLVVLLLWIYYSSMIMLFGAEFTEVYARRVGGRKPATPQATRPADIVAENMARSQAFVDAGRSKPV